MAPEVNDHAPTGEDMQALLEALEAAKVYKLTVTPEFLGYLRTHTRQPRAGIGRIGLEFDGIPVYVSSGMSVPWRLEEIG